MKYTAPEMMLLITALSAAVVSIITAWRTKGSIEAKVETTGKKTNKKLDEVHVLVNDKATKQDTRIGSLENQIKDLIAVIAVKDKDAAVLAEREMKKDIVTQNDSPAQVIENQIVENQTVEKRTESKVK